MGTTNTLDLNNRITALEKGESNYDSDKTATASGETLVLVPTSEGRALIHTAYGMSVQNGTPTPSTPVDIESAKANFTSTHGQDSYNVTTNITLRAIEVSSTDDYNLVRDNKYYIADTLDYSEDNGFVVTRRIKHNEWDENENWQRYSTAGRDTYYVTKNDAKSNIKSYCNLFNMMPTVTTVIGEGFIHTNHGANFNYSGQNESTLNDWLTFVKNNHIKIDYILDTPITETITTEQALALLGLKTYDESTTISSQAEPSCTIAVEYAKERLGALALTAYNTAKGNDLRIKALES